MYGSYIAGMHLRQIEQVPGIFSLGRYIDRWEMATWKDVTETKLVSTGILTEHIRSITYNDGA
jgi:protein tyrosine phosphatase